MPLFDRSTHDKAKGKGVAVSGVEASRGSNAAGGDVVNSVAVHVENGVVLPPEAYWPAADVLAPERLRNVPGTGLFVGRRQALDALDAALAAPGGVVVQAVHGLGGIGKSTLAAHWAIHHFTGNPRWWITADSRPAIDTGLAELARALQPALTGLPDELLVERALQWLATHEDWLIVLDNVEHVDHIRPLLDRTGTGRGRFLITTRRATGWHTTATPLRLDVLTAGEAVDLFTRIVKPTHPNLTKDSDGSSVIDGVVELCEQLGYLPLAVEQAGSYCAETATTPRTYLQMLAESPADMFTDTAEGGDAGRTIARIWRITLDQLTDTRLAGDILRILAWYAPNHIPRTLLDGLAPAPALNKAIGRLNAYSLITTTGDSELAVHRLVQALARTPDPDDPHRQTTDINHGRDHAAVRLDTLFPTDVESPHAWPQCLALLPHVDALTEHLPTHLDTEITAHLLTKVGGFLHDQGLITRAIEHLERACTSRVRVLGEDHRHTLTSRNNLAMAYQAAGDFGRAIPLFEHTLNGSTRVQGHDDRDTLSYGNNLAMAYQEAGDLGRAVPLFEHTLSGSVRVLGDHHPDTLTARNNLAGAYSELGDWGRAIPLFERTLTDRVQVLGIDHPSTLTSRNNLAGAYKSAGDLGRAIPLYERTLTERVQVLGADHPATLQSRNNLASAYQTAGDLGRAIPLFEQVTTDRLRVLGNDHPDTLASHNNLATAYQTAGDLNRAIPRFERAVTDCLRVLGNDHPGTLAARNNLASAHESAGNLGRAIPLYEQAVTDCLRVLGNDHPDTLVSRINLAHAYQAAGHFGRAIPLYERNLASRLQILGSDHPDTLAFRNNLAHAYLTAGHFGRAIPLYERALTDSMRVLGNDHPDTLVSRNNLAYAYQLAGTLAERSRSLSTTWPIACRYWAPTTPTLWPPATTSPAAISQQGTLAERSRSTSAL
ncbi:tetratricopeptide repeat protein [Streptomyces agglomeratus]|uniref:tetratricopeptide repeat protein n=1 Tax=Streptomyces agglomeratus TaxID=285458 RepID=UPI000AFEBEB2|nr:tetratricopeptide repeat protein [Streptomyces agglomeratus]